MLMSFTVLLGAEISRINDDHSFSWYLLIWFQLVQAIELSHSLIHWFWPIFKFGKGILRESQRLHLSTAFKEKVNCTNIPSIYLIKQIFKQMPYPNTNIPIEMCLGYGKSILPLGKRERLFWLINFTNNSEFKCNFINIHFVLIIT